MTILYSIVLYILCGIVWFLNTTRVVCLLPKESKVRKFIVGQKDAINASMISFVGAENVVWVHASSLGEYSVVRPIVQKLREEGAKIVLTFFSSTGYEALSGGSSSDKEAEIVLYLPLDSHYNARQFVDNIRPMKAIFAVSEIWPNYLAELHKRRIPIFMVGMKISRKSSSMRWYGALFRQALRYFTVIMVIDHTSETLLREKHIFSNVVHIGDPLFDNALSVAQQEFSDPIIEQFCEGKRVFIAGSVSDYKDIKLISSLANSYPQERFIVVPHELKTHFINAVRSSFKGKSALYTTCTPSSDLSDTQILLVNVLGVLSKIYRYCAYAYVGGGFTKKLHSVIEPVVYGLPTSFGPKTYRKNTPKELISLGIGAIVSTPEELIAWFANLHNDEVQLAKISQKAIEYTTQNCGSIDTIIALLNTPCIE